MPNDDPVVLERLAATQWFAQHGEVALTAGLAFCLEKDPAAAQAFMALLRARARCTDDELPGPDRWEAESPDPKKQRVDVAGWHDTGGAAAPVVLVEAEVSAAFAPHQVSSYLQSQQTRLREARASAGALAVLVPGSRLRATREEVAADLQCLDAIAQDGRWIVGDWPPVTVTVVSWGEVVEAMLVPEGPAACDLAQLLGACRALQGADVTAFTDNDLAGAWRTRKDDLRLVIDRVTQEATARLSFRLLPWQGNPLGGLEGGYRYLGPSELFLAVGIRSDEANPPLWLRWHSSTRDLGLVENRLADAGYTVEQHEGHLWLPLEFKPDRGSATPQIEHLVVQVVTLYKIAAQPEPD